MNSNPSLIKIQNYSYHNHTKFSDGQNSLEEMLEQAVKLDLKEIGITDHLIIHKYARQTKRFEECSFESSRITYVYSLEESKEVLKKQVEYIRDTAKKYPIKVLVSFEVDFFDYPEWESELKYLISDLDLDYLFTGNHHYIYNDRMRFLLRLHRHTEDKTIQDEILSNHFKLITKAIYSKLFDFIGHIDWACSGKVCGIDDFKEERMEIIKALVETNTPYEINTRGFRRASEQYPALWMIQELAKYNVPVFISDDAHRCKEITKDFTKAEQILSDLNYTNRFKF